MQDFSDLEARLLIFSLLHFVQCVDVQCLEWDLISH